MIWLYVNLTLKCFGIHSVHNSHSECLCVFKFIYCFDSLCLQTHKFQYEHTHFGHYHGMKYERYTANGCVSISKKQKVIDGRFWQKGRKQIGQNRNVTDFISYEYCIKDDLNMWQILTDSNCWIKQRTRSFIFCSNHLRNELKRI